MDRNSLSWSSCKNSSQVAEPKSAKMAWHRMGLLDQNPNRKKVVLRRKKVVLDAQNPRFPPARPVPGSAPIHVPREVAPVEASTTSGERNDFKKTKNEENK